MVVVPLKSVVYKSIIMLTERRLWKKDQFIRAYKKTDRPKKPSSKSDRKLSEYGRQLEEKQKVKEMYGMREAQFKRFFCISYSK